MEKYKIRKLKNSGTNVLNNIGGPHTSVMTETVSSNIFNNKCLKVNKKESLVFSVKQNKPDVENLILRLCKKLGWKNAEEAEIKLKLPSEKLLIIPNGPVPEVNIPDLKKLLRSGLILSKCSEIYYNPDSPMIFTVNRLHRNIELIKININNYYELD